MDGRADPARGCGMGSGDNAGICSTTKDCRTAEAMNQASLEQSAELSTHPMSRGPIRGEV
jgi:hypothetical protein